MKADDAATHTRNPLLFLCLLLVALAVCASFFFIHDHRSSVGEEPAFSPVPTFSQRKYVSRFTQTPVPSLPSVRLSSPAPTAAVSASPIPTLAPVGLLGDKYSWRFSEKEILTDHSYSSKDVSISWDVYRDEVNYGKPVTFYVADVLVQDVTRLRTAFAKGTYKAGGVRSMETIAKNSNCIIAISGDFARWHQNGLIIRNGEVFRQKRFTSDLCVLYADGVMETYEPGTISLQEIMDNNPWQSWHFGPELLDRQGQPKKKFNTGVWGRNPRSVIGYYEPGHYCLVVADGRQGRYSGGLDMRELSQLMYALGCVRAYNLDGGATAHMSWIDKVVNSPSKDRKVNDVICVCFPEQS